jgi:mannosyltransferase
MLIKLTSFNITKTVLVAILIFTLNLAFKLINITAEPIWYDECFSIFYSQGNFDEILTVSMWDINPPFFNLCLHIWINFFGISELSMRLVPAIFSSLASGVLFLFLKRYVGFRSAITASVLYLFSNISFLFAQEVRTYSFILLISIVSFWLFIRMIEKPSYLISILLGLTYYILIMSHYLTFFILFSQGIVFLIFFNKILLKYYLISVLAFVLLLAHWITRIAEIVNGSSKHWLKSPNLNNLVDVTYSISNGKTQLAFLFILTCISITIILIKKETFLPNKYIKAIFIYSILISIVTVTLNYLISFTIPIFLDRYLLFTLIGFIIFYSICISRLPFSDFYYYILLLIISINAFIQVQIDVPTRKMDYRSAVCYVKQHEDSNCAIFIQTIDVTSLFMYYYDRAIFKDFSNFEKKRKAKSIFRGNDSTQLIKELNDSYSQVIHIETYSEAADLNKNVAAWFKVHGYIKVLEENSYNQVKIGVYRKQEY